MKQVVRAAAVAVVLLTGLSAQAALVKFRITGVVTQSTAFDDGTVVPEGAKVSISYTYESKQAPTSFDRREDGSGMSAYDIAGPYHFKLSVGDHRVRANAYRVALSNDLHQAFGDTYDVEATSGLYIDGNWMPGGKLSLSLLSWPGHGDALKSLHLPKHLREGAFDAFRVGHLWRDANHALLSFAVTNVKSSVCDQAVPGTDTCADDQ
jgi:hypothetical protein